MADPLPDERIAAALAQLPGWSREGEALTCIWRFPSFAAAMAFMADAAPEIDRLDHHPEWTNRRDRVHIRLCTDDAGDRITSADIQVAKILTWVAERHQG